MGNFPSRKHPRIDPVAIEMFNQVFGSNARLRLSLDFQTNLDLELRLADLTLVEIGTHHSELNEIKICVFQQPSLDQFKLQGYYPHSRYRTTLNFYRNSFSPYHIRKGWWLVVKEDLWARNHFELGGLLFLNAVPCLRIPYLEHQDYYLTEKDPEAE